MDKEIGSSGCGADFKAKLKRWLGRAQPELGGVAWISESGPLWRRLCGRVTIVQVCQSLGCCRKHISSANTSRIGAGRRAWASNG